MNEQNMIVYFNGEFIPLSDVKISPFDRGFLFGDGVYEVIRSYNKKLFHIDSHLARLKYSLNELKINFTDLYSFFEIISKLVFYNSISERDYLVYIQITRGVQSTRQHNFDLNHHPTVFVYLSELDIQREKLADGVKVILDEDIRWSRCDIKSISLLPSTLAKTKAINSGAYETIFHRDGKITEGSHTNFFAVRNNIVYTAPLSKFVLKGITRDIIIDLCRENNIKVVEDYICIDQLDSYDEFFITGTKTEVTPVTHIDDRMVKDASAGGLTKQIQKLFYKYINKTCN
jgi:D-alanine transaminase